MAGNIRRLQLTLALFKPDITANPIIVERIKQIIHQNNFLFVESKTLKLSRSESEAFYVEHKDRFFYNRLVNYISSGPLSAHILARHDAVAMWRQIMGPTKVLKTVYSSPNSIRGRFGLTDTRNGVHGSDSTQSAQLEIEYFFPGFQVEKWIKENEENFSHKMEDQQREFEVQSIASLFGAKLSVPEDYDPKSPYLVVDLPDEECAKNIAGRAILIKSLYELWGQASDYDGLFSKLNALPEHFTTQYLSDCSTFRVRHDSFNKVISFQQKLELIENVLNNSGLRFSGGIDLKSPDHSFHLLEYYGRQDVACAPETPEIIYFGRWITNGHRESIKTYNLKKRKFIGNTSMDAALAMIMANMGQVNPSKLVFDLFVGTGSLLVASAHYGAYVLGTEIDWKLLHGRGRSSRANQKWRSRDENIRNSLSQYDLGHLYIDALVADASKHALWWKPEIFDAIITDPPYGIREQTRKVGTMKESVTISDEVKEGHIPEKVSYELSQILCDLLNFAAKHLRLGGRLVYWLPVYKEDYVAENVPRHPCLDLVANSEQPLSARIARRLVTMHKTKHFHPDLQLAELLEDHYKDASFRDKYFRPSEKGPRDVKKPKVKGTSRGQRERSLPPSYNEPCVDDPSARDDSHDTGCMNKMCLSDGPGVASVSATNRDNELITEIENKSTLMPNNWEDKG